MTGALQVDENGSEIGLTASLKMPMMPNQFDTGEQALAEVHTLLRMRELAVAASSETSTTLTNCATRR